MCPPNYRSSAAPVSVVAPPVLPKYTNSAYHSAILHTKLCFYQQKYLHSMTKHSGQLCHRELQLSSTIILVCYRAFKFGR